MEHLTVGCKPIRNCAVWTGETFQLDLCDSVRKQIGDKRPLDGFLDNFYQVTYCEETQEQIARVKQIPIVDIFDQSKAPEKVPVGWEFFQWVFDKILRWREMSQGGQVPMSSRPPIAVIGYEGSLRQVDLYAGHDWLEVDHITNCQDRMPNFSDLPSYGVRVDGLGMVDWRAGSFQSTIIRQAKPTSRHFNPQGRVKAGRK